MFGVRSEVSDPLKKELENRKVERVENCDIDIEYFLFSLF